MTVENIESSTTIIGRLVENVASTILLFLETAAQMSIGQTILRYLDRFLWVIEKSAQWSLPCQEIAAEENGKSFGKIELVRPLPWIFFLPALIILRALRTGLNIAALITGYPTIQPSGMVQFLQQSRRRVRAIKTNGMKNMRQKKYCENKEILKNSKISKWRANQLIQTIRLTLASLSCLDGSKLSPSPPPMRIKVGMNHESTPTPEEKSATESACSPLHVESKRKYSETSSSENSGNDSEEETVLAKLENLTSDDDDDDSTDENYIPPECSNSENEISSNSGESSVSATELQDIQDEANLLLHRAFAGVTEIIQEEPEPGKRDDREQKTVEDSQFENPNAGYTSENSEDHQDFHSPCKLEDGDTAFYSPISSNSSSPERTVTGSYEQDREYHAEGNITVRSVCRNGEINTDAKAPNFVGTIEQTTNGHAEKKSSIPTNISSKTNKPNYKGRRASHASRKKK